MHRLEDLSGGRVGGHGAGDDVGGVGVPAAGHPDIQRLDAGRGCGYGVAGVDGEPLGRINRRRVAQRDVLGDIARGQRQGGAELLAPAAAVGAVGAAGDRRDDQAAVVEGVQDAELLAVDRSAGIAVEAGEFPGVAAGLDQVASSGPGAVQAERDGVLVDVPEPDQVGAQLGGQAGGLFVGVDDEQRIPSGEGVGQPGPGGGLFGLLERAAVDQAAVLVVVREHGLIAVPQPQRRRTFPGGAEPAGLGQLVPQAAGGRVAGVWRPVPSRRPRRPRRAGGGHRPAAASRPLRRRWRGCGRWRRCRPSRTRRPRPDRRAAAATPCRPRTGGSRRGGPGWPATARYSAQPGLHRPAPRSHPPPSTSLRPSLSGPEPPGSPYTPLRAPCSVG
jgi:hypothetical protein